MPETTPGHPFNPRRTYRPSRALTIGNAIVGRLIWLGLVPGGYLLTVRGRKSGRPRTTPVVLVRHDGRRWLVAPYGAVAWVLNARAAGEVTLRRRFTRWPYAIREVPAHEAGPVLKRYVAIAGVTQPYFQARKDDPVRDFVAEAGHHPVFELVPAAVAKP